MLMHKLPGRHQLPFELQHCSQQLHVPFMHMYVHMYYLQTYIWIYLMWCTRKEHNIHTFEGGEIEGSASSLLCWHLVWLVLGLGTHIYLITPDVCRFSSFLCIAFVSFLFFFFFYFLYFLAALCFSYIK